MGVQKVLVAGSAMGKVIWSPTPLSFWGGVAPKTGIVIDKHHCLCGQDLTGRILVMPAGRGSCTSSVVLLECILSGHAPAAILLKEVDEIVALGAVLAEELFARTIPVIVVDEDTFDKVVSIDELEISRDGRLHVHGHIAQIN